MADLEHINPSDNKNPEKKADLPPPLQVSPAAGVPVSSSAPRGSADPALFSSQPIVLDDGVSIDASPENETSVRADVSAALGGSSQIEKPIVPPKEITQPPHVKPAAQIPQAPSSGLSRVRTYKDDLANAVKKRQISVVGMIAAESDRGTKAQALQNPAQKERGGNRWIIIGSIILIAIGIAAAVGAYVYTRNTQTPGGENVLPSLIFSNKVSTVRVAADATGYGFLAELTKIRNTSVISLGEIEQLRLVTDAQLELSSQSFLTVIDAGVSGPFTRSLGTRMMLGLHAFDRSQPFIVFTVSDYERAFSGMLEWERTLANDLDPLFAPQSTLLPGTTNGASFPTFEDRVVRNVNARVLLREDGSTRIVYAFPRRDILIITTNESTLREVLTRLAQTPQ